MKQPSPGNADPTRRDDRKETGDDHPGGSGHTRTSVDGEKSPRLPHERDESTDTGRHASTEQMRNAHDDAESPKQPTDKSKETDAAYSKLRGRVPGKERDADGG